MYQQFFIEKQKAVDNKMIITGKATTSKLDLHNERNLITPNAHKVAWTAFKDKGAPVIVEHGKNFRFGDRIVGRVISMQYTPENLDLDTVGVPEFAIYATVEIFDSEVIALIEAGKMLNFSLRWRGPRHGVATIQAANYEEFRVAHYVELSVCAIPINSDASFTTVKSAQAADYGFSVKVGEEVYSPETGEIMKVKALVLNQGFDAFYEVEDMITKEKSYVSVATDISTDILKEKALTSLLPVTELAQVYAAARGNTPTRHNWAMSKVEAYIANHTTPRLDTLFPRFFH